MSTDSVHSLVGFSNRTLILVSLVGFFMLFLILKVIMIQISKLTKNHRPHDHLLLLGNNNNDTNHNMAPNYNDQLLQADVRKLNRAQRRARAKLEKKKHLRLADHAQVLHEHEREDEGHHEQALVIVDDDEEEEENDDIQILQDFNPDNDGKSAMMLTRKERQKLAKIQEKEERKRYEYLRREQLLLEEAKEQDSSKCKEQREQQTHEEEDNIMDRWKDILFLPKKKAYDASTISMTIDDFIEYLKQHKMISIHDMAEKFSVTSSEFIVRLEQLEKENRFPLHGILDETNGLYILVTHEDMETIVQYVQNVGPMSIHDFSIGCSEIITAASLKTS